MICDFRRTENNQLHIYVYCRLPIQAFKANMFGRGSHDNKISLNPSRPPFSFN